MAIGSNGRQRLLDGNAMFRKNIDKSVLSVLAKGQKPLVAILSCSDSRVSPERVFNLSLGEAFIVRVVGNSAGEPSVIGSLEYAVGHLRVQSLVVLGHTGCGAVRAVLDGETPASLSSVVRDIERARYRLPIEHQNDADLISENNVRIQLRMIQDNSSAIARAVNEGKLELFGAVYDIVTGQVKFI
jgi:carbonic anhydrase